MACNPFEVSPDPYFFCPTPRHTEALANLAYGVLRRKGFVVLTGEVGTGKTLLLRCLFDALTRNKVAFAYMYNPMISVQEFFAHVINEFGLLPSQARTKSDALARLNNYLMERSRHDLTTALIVDEAQLLSWELLEEIRLLTNLETTKHKLLQIVLVGQPELEQKLDSPQLRQLKQRIGLRCNLKPLDMEELKDYIHRRLQLAGANSHAATIFPDETIAFIQKVSGGIPRLVNTVCENSLLLGLNHNQHQITPDIVQEVAEDLCLNRVAEDLSGSFDESKSQSGVKSE
ncbi:MAG TPA: AAA family ATPase [Candidatus Acidoferrales bacterium]|nr:AAA family ATPase [Candidatus Acidoferrales bacterium]